MLDIERYLASGVLGACGAVSENDSNRFADIAHDLVRNHRLREGRDCGIGTPERNGRHRRPDIACREHRMNARHPTGGACIDRFEPAVRNWTAHDRGVPKAHTREVIDILPASAQKPQILNAFDRTADQSIDLSHCTSIFASRMTLPQRASSWRTRMRLLSGVLASGLKPSVSSRRPVSGSATIFAISRWRRSTIALGVTAGARIMSMVSAS